MFVLAAGIVVGFCSTKAVDIVRVHPVKISRTNSIPASEEIRNFLAFLMDDSSG